MSEPEATGPPPNAPRADTGHRRQGRSGAVFGGVALTRARWAIAVGAALLLFAVTTVHIDLPGHMEMWLKFGLLFVVVFGPAILIDYLKNGSYF